jgi:hypothetical protein
MRSLRGAERDLLGRLASIDRAEVGLFEVTAVQLEKSIVDANFSIRTAFAATGFHDYLEQPQGKENKVVADLALLTANGMAETKVSLYRPNTKAGDPRLWIYRLESLCPEAKPGDLVAIVQDGETCVALNLSDRAKAGSSVDEVEELFTGNDTVVSGVASELLDRLRRIAATGPVQTDKTGDTAVGFAIETALGIPANSSRKPDYKGIEIKSGRSLRGNSNKTLFARMFDKDKSPVGSYAGLLDRCGYIKDDGLKYLQCSVDGRAPNSQGLALSVDYQDGLLKERWGEPASTELVAVWELGVLQAALAEKHAETFWVEASEVQTPTGIGFALGKVVHTSSPRLSAFTHFLSDGTVFVDHTIRQKRAGGTRDHGMLFRTKASNLPRLFKVEGEHLLV